MTTCEVDRQVSLYPLLVPTANTTQSPTSQPLHIYATPNHPPLRYSPCLRRGRRLYPSAKASRVRGTARSRFGLRTGAASSCTARSSESTQTMRERHTFGHEDCIMIHSLAPENVIRPTLTPPTLTLTPLTLIPLTFPANPHSHHT